MVNSRNSSHRQKRRSKHVSSRARSRVARRSIDYTRRLKDER